MLPMKHWTFQWIVGLALTVACGAGDKELSAPDASAPDTVAPDTTPPPSFPTPPEKLGGERPADYYLPADYTHDKTWPLVVLLHGFSANGQVQNLYLGISKHVDDLGFILVVPNGTMNPNGLRFWNATGACCDNFGQGVDDEAFLLGLLDETMTYFNVDPQRVSLLGHSNGGFMAYHMACHAGDRISAIASIAGSTYFDEADCPGTTPVSVLQIHGTQDQSIAFNGVPRSPMYAGYPSAVEIMERWRGRNGCDDDVSSVEAADLETLTAGEETDVTQWTQCTSGKSVALWQMNGVGHIPIFSDGAMPKALHFLLGESAP